MMSTRTCMYLYYRFALAVIKRNIAHVTFKIYMRFSYFITAVIKHFYPQNVVSLILQHWGVFMSPLFQGEESRITTISYRVKCEEFQVFTCCCCKDDSLQCFHRPLLYSFAPVGWSKVMFSWYFFTTEANLIQIRSHDPLSKN